MSRAVLSSTYANHSFFQFCHLYGSADPVPAGSMQPVRIQQKQGLEKQTGPDGDKKGSDEPEVITSFSYRNFFSVINFVHVLQKLTKRKPHRILLLVQYKSSVSTLDANHAPDLY